MALTLPSDWMPLQEPWGASQYILLDDGAWTFVPPNPGLERPEDYQIRSPRITGEISYVFAYKQSRQLSCHLLNLPPELRLIILRYTLKRPEPIPLCRGRSCSLVNLKGLPLANLSAQILQCCQLLLNEGSEILYGENTLSFHFLNGRQRPVRHCCMHNLVRYVMRTRPHLEELEPSYDLHSALLARVSKTTREEWYGYDRTVAYYPSLSRIRSFDIQIQCRTYNELYTTVHLLRNLLKEKDVTLDPNLLNRGTSTVGRPNPIDALRVLRCRSVKFQASEPPKGIESVISTITSNEPVVDLLKPWKELRSIIHRMPCGEDQEFSDWLDTAPNYDGSAAMKDAIFTNDSTAFGVLKTQILEHAKLWVDRWTNERKQAAWQQYMDELVDIEDQQVKTIQRLKSAADRIGG